MVDVTSFFFLMPVLALAFVVVFAFSRARLAPKVLPARKPRFLEIAASIVLVVLSAIAYWLLRSAVPDSFWATFAQPGKALQLLYYTFFVLLPVMLALWSLGSELRSVRLTAANWRFSMALGFSASLVTLIPSMVADPRLIEKLASNSWLFYFSWVYAVLCEELLFRGLFQTKMEGLVGARGGILLTALVYQLWYYPTMILDVGLSPGFFFANAIATVLPPLLFGYIAWRSDNLIGSTIYHVSYNSLLLALN